ncbi:hypothetical protein [Macrococcus capreoli]|uniref:hypothetical protein n=1 Tax=Macrococcus capreoli TaxID=2982690 RepID=UPI003F4452BB
MTDHINWKERYLELESQILDMMKMTQRLIIDERNHQNAYVNKTVINQIDDTLEIVAIAVGNKPQFLFEVINEKEKVLYRKHTKYKNSIKINQLLFKEPFKIKISIKNDTSESFTSFYETHILNEESAY